MAALLSEEDKKAIAEAIRGAELKTSGEIVFSLAQSSGNYRYADFQGALSGMAAATVLYLLLPLHHSVLGLLWTEVLAFLAFLLLFSRLPIRRWFIAPEEMETRTWHAAFTQFYEHGLYRTRESNAVLIYLSQFEKRVVVLGDKGIHGKMGDVKWNEVKDLIVQGIHNGRPREGICQAIEVCGQMLAQHFPRPPDDTDELSNRVIG